MSDAEPGAYGLATLPNGWQVGRFDALMRLPGIVHAVTTRRGPDVSAVAGDRVAAAARLADALGLADVAICNQVHGADVLRVDSGGLVGDGDALVTGRPGLGVMAFSADCPLILAADAAGPAVGVAHASWRGTIRRIAARLIETLADQFGAEPANVVACIGPSAGPCCYEVGGEVLAAAVEALGPSAERFFRRRPGPGGRFLLDLWSANRDQLLRAGLPRRNIHAAAVCTLCRNDLYPSQRAEGDAAGRFVALIARTADAGASQQPAPLPPA
jgi:hypothetical protein